MPAEVLPGTGPTPRRARYLIPTQFPRRGEIGAALGVLIVVVHLLLAQLTLLLAVVFAVTSRATRWRLWWLAAPAMAGLLWTLAVGRHAAMAGFTAGPSHILAYLGGDGHPLHGLLHPHGAFADAGSWLPRQLPLALIAASAEAALAGWLDWLHTDEWAVPAPRPGLVAAARREATRRAIRAGAVVTRDGANLGVAAVTGARAGLGWTEVAGGVLFAGTAEREVAVTSFQLVHAALRRRMPVIAVDLGGDAAAAETFTTACSATGMPLRTFGTADGCYEPFRDGDPARRTEMVLALIGGDGPPAKNAPAAAVCLRAAFELMVAVPADPRTPALDDVIHLLNPAAMRARLALVPADSPSAGQITGHVRAAAQAIQTSPEAIAAVARELAAVRAAPAGRWLRPGGIHLATAVRIRSAALFRLDSAGMARLVCADLLGLCEDLQRIGTDGDGIVWICGCEQLPSQTLARLISSGAAAGLRVLATTTSPAAAMAAAGAAGTLVLHRLADAEAAASMAARTGTRVVSARVPAAYPGVQSAALEGARATAAAGGPVPAPQAMGAMAPGPAGGIVGMAAALDGARAPAAVSLPGARELVYGPAVPAHTLLSLRPAEFVLAVNSPRYRLVERGQTVPARIPRAAMADKVARGTPAAIRRKTP